MYVECVRQHAAVHYVTYNNDGDSLYTTAETVEDYLTGCVPFGGGKQTLVETGSSFFTCKGKGCKATSMWCASTPTGTLADTGA